MVSPAFVSPRAGQQPRAWAWLALLLAAYAVSIIDRIGIGLLVAPMQRDLHLDDTAMGLVQGLAFGLFYIGLALPIGQMIDRGDRRRILAAGIAIWSVATLASGFVGGLATLFACRLLVGAGEATLTPASSALIADLFPARRRPLAYGIFTCGVAVGVGLALLFVGGLFGLAPAINRTLAPLGVALADWRLTFVAMALPGFVVALLLLAMQQPARRAAATPAMEPGAKASLRDPFRHIARAPRPFVALLLGTAMAQFSGNVMIAWFPTVLVRSHGMSPAEIGGTIGPIAVAAGVPSALSAGLLIAWLARRDPDRAAFHVLAATVLLYPLTGIAAVLAGSSGDALLWYGAGVLVSNWSTPAMLSGLALLSPARLQARMVALQMLLIGIVSLGIGPALTGFVADRFFPTPTGLAAAMACVFGAAILLGGAAMLPGYGGIRRALVIRDE